ncbi:B1 protein-like [Anoplophora glabripennis]|nr:B1 protein-like [Anoplophora glabripennis]
MTNAQKQTMYEECVSETGVNEEIIENAMAGEFADDPKFRLFLSCFAKKRGVLNDAGEIQKHTLRAELSSMISDEALVEDIMARCVVQSGTPEETAFQISKCIHARKQS